MGLYLVLFHEVGFKKRVHPLLKMPFQLYFFSLQVLFHIPGLAETLYKCLNVMNEFSWHVSLYVGGN